MARVPPQATLRSNPWTSLAVPLSGPGEDSAVVAAGKLAQRKRAMEALSHGLEDRRAKYAQQKQIKDFYIPGKTARAEPSNSRSLVRACVAASLTVRFARQVRPTGHIASSFRRARRIRWRRVLSLTLNRQAEE